MTSRDVENKEDKIDMLVPQLLFEGQIYPPTFRSANMALQLSFLSHIYHYADTILHNNMRFMQTCSWLLPLISV